MLHIWRSTIDKELPNERFLSLLERIPARLHTDVTRYRFWPDRQARLAVRLLLRLAFQELGLGYGLDDWEVDHNGRPFVTVGAAHFVDFNFSHTREIAVCAVSLEQRVGIDVECVQEIDLNTYQNILSSEEQRAILSGPLPKVRFFEIWTQKESMMKADGRGMSTPMLDVTASPREMSVEGMPYVVSPVDVGEGHVCHVATRLPHAPISVRHVEIFDG